MNVSSASDFSNSLASMATDMQGGNLQLKITMAVFKEIQGSQDQMAKALIQMMEQTRSLTGTGSIVNVSA